MLRIAVPISPEGWDEVKQEFVEPKFQHLQLEHSLVSLSKWESKWCKPFFSKEEKTYEETADYVRCMTLTQNVKPEVYNCLSSENVAQINAYIEAPMTATTFVEEKDKKKINGEIVTAEIIYYWMIALNIPFECQKWHLNKLLTLIRVCNKKNEPPKKMTTAERKALNEARKKKHKTRG